MASRRSGEMSFGHLASATKGLWMCPWHQLWQGSAILSHSKLFHDQLFQAIFSFVKVKQQKTQMTMVERMQQLRGDPIDVAAPGILQGTPPSKQGGKLMGLLNALQDREQSSH